MTYSLFIVLLAVWFFLPSIPVFFLHTLSSAYYSIHILAGAVTVVGFHAQSRRGYRSDWCVEKGR